MYVYAATASFNIYPINNMHRSSYIHVGLHKTIRPQASKFTRLYLKVMYMYIMYMMPGLYIPTGLHYHYDTLHVHRVNRAMFAHIQAHGV